MLKQAGQKCWASGFVLPFASVGRALWITTIVLSLGFSVFDVGPFCFNTRYGGMLTSNLIMVALAVDFLVFTRFFARFRMQKSVNKDKTIHDQ